MRFRDIAFKNLKANFRKYISYLMFSSFSIIFFFIFATLVFNEHWHQRIGDTPLYNFSVILLAVLGLFGVIFISYAYSSFISYREKEFGLLMSLGMTERNLSRLIKIENRYIALGSLTIGLVIGTIFAKLFFAIVSGILGLEGIPFQLNPISYLWTIGLFAVIFWVASIVSRRKVKRLQVIRLLKGGSKAVDFASHQPLMGIRGLVVVVISLVLLKQHIGENYLAHITYLPAFLICLTFFGLYMTISNIGSTLLYVMKFFKTSYYKNLLHITEIQYKFAQYKKIIFVITCVTAFVIYFIGSTYSMRTVTTALAEENSPFDFMYVTRNEFNEIFEKEVDSYLATGANKATNFRTLEFFKIPIIRQGQNGPVNYPVEVVSVVEINQLLDEPVTVEQGEAIFLEKARKGPAKSFDSKLTLVAEDQNFEFRYIMDLRDRAVNICRKSTTSIMIILHPIDYQQVRDHTPNASKGVYQIIDFADWKDVTDLTERLNKLIGTLDEGLDATFSRYSIFSEVSTRYGLLQSYKQEDMYFFFITNFIGLLFFLGAGSVLYFKLFADLEDTKEKLAKLNRLGISRQMVKRLISQELQVLFFLPFVLGSIVGYAFIYATINPTHRAEFLLNSTVIVAIYLAFQLVYYLSARKKYLSQVIDHSR